MVAAVSRACSADSLWKGAYVLRRRRECRSGHAHVRIRDERLAQRRQRALDAPRLARGVEDRDHLSLAHAREAGRASLREQALGFLERLEPLGWVLARRAFDELNEVFGDAGRALAEGRKGLGQVRAEYVMGVLGPEGYIAREH